MRESGVDKQPVILIAVLDWGLGHATRCIPIIDYLLAQSYPILLAGSGRSLLLLKKTYPHLDFVELPAYDISYSRTRWQIPYLITQLPRIFHVIRQEHKLIREIVADCAVKAILSDNRYGVWHPNFASVFMCHQLAPYVPGVKNTWIYRLHKKFIRQFDQIWIPDQAHTVNLSGRLSHELPYTDAESFIGPLSRFYQYPVPKVPSQKEFQDFPPQILAIVSGPEPQRTLLSKKLHEQAKFINEWVWIVEGKPEQAYVEIDTINKVVVIAHLMTSDLVFALHKTQIVISRPGYSSIMDYWAMGIRQMILIPTPGQTEQTYLATHLNVLAGIQVYDQQHFDLFQALKRVEMSKSESPTFDFNQYRAHLDEWISGL